MTALTLGNLRIRAVGFQTLPGSAVICLSVAGRVDLTAAALKAMSKSFIRSRIVSMTVSTTVSMRA
jgi:hypothetical protein